jgi:peptidoglycan/LPS O-acetylase OafA/YrhL
MAIAKKKPLLPLTSLRFFAALAISVHHCNGVFWPAAELGPLDVGVSFFFVLSGFILTYVYDDIRAHPADLLNFYRARLARIWPAHLVCLLLTMAFIAIPEPFNADVLAANALLLHAWIPFDRYFFSYNYVSWSISTELFFYLVFPFLIVHAQRWLSRGMLLALLIVATLALISYWAHLPTWDTLHDHLSSTGLLYANPLARFAEFLLGTAIGMFFLNERQDVPKRPVAWTIAEIASVALFLIGYRYFLLSFAPVIHEAMLSVGATKVPLTSIGAETAALAQISPFASQFVDEWANHVGLTPFAAILIYVFAHQQGALSKALSHRWLVFLGEISFALYLVHQIALRYFQQHALRTDWIGFCAFIACALLMAAALHLLIENPARKWLTRPMLMSPLGES